jgi:hypothetical protein
VGPFAEAQGHDAPRLIDKLVPGVTAVIDDIVVGFEDAVREPVVAHELPDVLDRIELRASGWQRHERDVFGHDQFGRAVPSGLIEQDDGVCAGRDVEGDLFEMHAHGLAVALGHDNAGSLAFSRADRPEDPCRGTTLILRRTGAGATPCPAPGELGLLADTGFVLPPQLYTRSFRKPAGDLRQTGAEGFLKAAISSGRCPWWRGRVESLR